MDERMTADDFVRLQNEIGATGVRLAEWLGLHPQAINRYRKGKVMIPGPVALSMKALASGWRP